MMSDRSSRIAVRTRDGWVYAKPGYHIMMTNNWFNAHNPMPNPNRMVRNFSVVEIP